MTGCARDTGTDLDGSRILLQANDLADQALRADADQLVHGRAGHGFGHDDGAADLQDGPAWEGGGKGSRVSIRSSSCSLSCMHETSGIEGTHPVFSPVGAMVLAGGPTDYAIGSALDEIRRNCDLGLRVVHLP